MASLEYSSAALDTLPKFHRVSYVIFVEGQDDMIFWDNVFQHFKLKKYFLRIAGGKNELEKCIKAIVEEDSSICVARDSDYVELDGTQVLHHRILYTFGYSIENSLYCPGSISKAIATYSRIPGSFGTTSSKWLDSFAKKCTRLLIYDLANQMFGRGQKVLGDNCTRFLTSATAHETASEKIKVHCQTLRSTIAKNEISIAKRLIESSSKPIRFILKGHFLSTAVNNYIKNQVSKIGGRSVSISNESLFVFFVNNFLADCNYDDDIRYLETQVDMLRSDSK